MKPRRVLIFSFAYYPRFVGGAEVAVKEITDRISPGGAEFDMVTIGDGRRISAEKIGNIAIYRVFKDKNFLTKLLFPFAAYLKASSLHRKRSYDAIWSIMANRAGFAALFFKWSHRKIPFILTLQEGDPLDYPLKRGWMAAPIFRYIFRCADMITALSTFLADWAKEMGAKVPIEVIPNAVDYEAFATPVSRIRFAAAESRIGKGPGDEILITTSRLVKKNAVGDVIEALDVLRASASGSFSMKLLVLGEGPDEVMLKKKAADLKLSDRVYFLGHVDRSEMPEYLQISDIFIRPSRSEGFGISFVEAMAAGLPVIATPVGGIPDFLTDGETGLFCEVSNPRSIAQKVEKLIKDHESRDYIVKTARAMVEARYQWQGIALRMKTIFESARLG